MAEIKKKPGQDNKRALKKLKPWLGNGTARIRSLGRPMASRASKGSR